MAINRDKPKSTAPKSASATGPTAKPVTFSAEALETLLAEAAAKAVAQFKLDSAAPTKISVAGKTERAVKNEIAAVRAFQKIGIKATPHVDTFTFNKWVSMGYRPKEGSRSVRVANLRLFHKSQCRPITAEERAAMTEQSAAAVARHEQASKSASGTKGKVVAFKGL